MRRRRTTLQPEDTYETDLTAQLEQLQTRLHSTVTEDRDWWKQQAEELQRKVQHWRDIATTNHLYPPRAPK